MTLPARVRNESLGNTCLKILALIEANHGCTLRSLGRAVGVFPHAVVCHLRRLERFGLVRVERGKARTAVATCRFVPLEELAAADHISRRRL